MATIGTISPTLTKAGKAAMSAQGTGVSLKIDGVTFGTGKYNPTGDELGMTAQVGSKVTIRAGAKPNPYQIRIISVWNQDVGQVPITEVIWWQGNVPVFVWSVLSTADAISVKTDGVPLVLFSELGFADSAPGSVSFVLDPTESVALAALLEHEVSAGDPHTQYLPWSRFPDAMAYLWAKTVDGTANAITLTMGTGVDVTEYQKGQTFRFQPAFTNTGAVTLKINALAAKAFTKNAGEALIAGDLKKGAVYDAIFDGASFKLGSQAGATLINNTLSSSSTTEALSAAMGKKLNEDKLAYVAAASVVLKVLAAEYLSVSAAVMNIGADIASIRIKGFDAWHAGNQLALGTTAATARAALVLGTLALQNADNVNITGGLIKGQLSHASGYFSLGAFAESSDDGSVLRAWWNGITEVMEFRNSDGGFVTLNANYFQGNGSKLNALNGSQITTGIIAAARLGILDIGTTPATARAALLLGAAALMGVQSDTDDITPNVLMRNGAHGLGASGGRVVVLADATTPIGHYRATLTDPDNPFGANCTVEVERYAASGGVKQTLTNVHSVGANRQVYRTHNGISWTKWNEVFSSLNQLPLGTTPASAAAALELGTMAKQNADAVNIAGGQVSAILAHTSGYLVISPFGATHNDGSTLRAYWDGNTGRLMFFRSGGTGAAGATISATGFIGDGSFLTNLNGSQILSGIIAAARLGILNIGTTAATARAALELGSMASQNAQSVDIAGGKVKAALSHSGGYVHVSPYNESYDNGTTGQFYWSGVAAAFVFRQTGGPSTGAAISAAYFQGDGGQLTGLNGSAVTGGVIAPAYLGLLNIGTTPTTARTALALGSLATQNAENVNISGGTVKGQLTHRSGYMTLAPFSPAMDDGSLLRQYWDGTAATLNFRNTSGGYVTLSANYFQGNGSLLASLNGSQVTTGTIAAARLGILNIGTTSATARAALELGTLASQNYGAVTITGGAITGTYGLHTTGNAGSATRLATPRAINDVPFDGTANITVTITPIQAGVAISGQFGRELGTYSLLFNDTGAIINMNEEIAGSSLRFSGSGTPSATRPTGTWRCMSYSHPNQSGLYMRMA